MALCVKRGSEERVTVRAPWGEEGRVVGEGIETERGLVTQERGEDFKSRALSWGKETTI